MHFACITIELTADGVALVVVDLLFLHLIAGEGLSTRAALDVMP
ncbi:hypothetical protein ACFSRY_19735 [Pontibacter locisalis]|uniref:Uncharacterized protein n=1 Tax=Pontibacter locisalis TaxID=1719035 RepID=A0ABW5IRY7_9BACT